MLRFRKKDLPSSTVQEYVEALYRLQQGERPVRAASLAAHLKVSRSAAVEMLRKLLQQGLADQVKDQGYILSREGEGLALHLLRTHRLSERFLTDILGISWDKVHEEACQLEHTLSPEVEAALEELLDKPATCPHGQPIPDKEGLFREEATRPLAEMVPGEKGTIMKISEEEPGLLKYLATLGLLPQASVTIEEVVPLGGPILVQLGASKYALGREIASKILVKEG
ncbi:MAG: metal-dependent transcriptional regulator [candidate division NC10 bacterium]|nr:metal-dependent transcriptional regulator [candidate division NC10 bacterium]